MDEINRKILALLAQNADMAVTQISAAVGLSVPAVNKRIQKLRQDGVIQRFTVLTDARQVGKTITAFILVVLKSSGEIQKLLDRYQDGGKEPNPMAKGMSHMKTGMKLAMEDTDATIADLMTDGCNMGVKSLNRYLNQYKAADEVSKNIAKRLINLEEKLAIDIRQYL